MERKINYQLELQKILDVVKDYNKKPTLLLHACCGPCSTIPLKELKDYFDITIYYNNSNIYPSEEYERRLNELKMYLKKAHNDEIKLIVPPYDNENYNKILEPYADQKEGHERCRVCFKERLGGTYKYAAEHGYDYCGTVMSISRYKNSQDLNKIGKELQELYPTTKWLFADFKKQNGYEDSLVIIRNYHMYFQEYCGCKYSYKAYQNKHKND